MEFSQPRGEVTTTNFEQEASQKPAVRDLDPSSLKKPFDIFGTRDSLDGLLAPSLQRAPSPTIQSKKARELLEKRRNWVFNTEEEMYGLKSPEDILKMRKFAPNGEEEKETSSLERFWERLERKPGMTNDANGNPVAVSVVKSDGGEEQKLSFTPGNDRAGHADPADLDRDGTRGQNRVEASPTTAEAFQSPAPEKSFAEFFGLATGPAPDKTLEKNSAREMRMDQYRQLFVGGSPATSVSPAASSFAPASAGRFNVLPANPSPFAPAFSAPAVSPTFSAPAGFSGLQGLPSSTAPGASSFTPAFSAPTPAPAQTRPLFPAPAFDPPKRKF